MNRNPELESLSIALRAPFPLESLGFKPQTVKQNRALAVAFIDARDVMDRLDEVVGPENWSDDFTPLGDGQVMCKLSLFIGDRWVTKCDVGGESEQPDKGDREKAAFSDALKRAAVKFGIGRYLYSMPAQWCDYDPVKKQFTQTPQVAAKFLPAGAAPQKPAQAPAKPAAAPATGDPVTDRSAFAALLTQKRRSWALCIEWLNAHCKPARPYVAEGNERTIYLEIPLEHRQKLVADLRTMPDLEAATAKG